MDYQNQNPYEQNSNTQTQSTSQGQNPYYQQNPYQQSSYQQPQYQTYQNTGDMEEPMSVKEWLITDLLLLIPCVNIILVFVWAFSSSEKKSKSNYFKANLIFAGCVLAFYLIIVIIMVAMGVAFSSF